MHVSATLLSAVALCQFVLEYDPIYMLSVIKNDGITFMITSYLQLQ